MKKALTFLLFMLYASSAFGGHAGIWKSTQPPCNFYIQTYQGNNSILIIVTPNATTEWYVFLDPNIYDDVNVAEMTGKAATLAFYLRGSDAALADLTVNGKSTVYNLTKTQEGDCRWIDGGGGAVVNAPSISSLQYSPTSARVGEGGGAVTILGTVDLIDADGDVYMLRQSEPTNCDNSERTYSDLVDSDLDRIDF